MIVLGCPPDSLRAIIYRGGPSMGKQEHAAAALS